MLTIMIYIIYDHPNFSFDCYDCQESRLIIFYDPLIRDLKYQHAHDIVYVQYNL